MEKSPQYNENFEQKKLNYLIMDMGGDEPVVLAQEMTDDPDSFVEEFERSTGKKFENNPNLIVATENPDDEPAIA